MVTIGIILSYVLWLYQVVLLARIVISLVEAFVPQWRPRGFLLLVAEVVYTLTDPPIKFLRRFVRPLRLGQISLDLSVLLLWLALGLLMRLNDYVFFGR